MRHTHALARAGRCDQITIGNTVNRLASLLLMAVGALLSACGGGDAPQGNFTLSTSDVSFSAYRNEALPAAQAVRMHLTDGKSAYVGAGYRSGIAPEWLAVEITGTAPDYEVTLSISTAAIAPGEYRSTLTVGTADANGTILQTKDIAVAYTLSQRLAFATDSVSIAYVFGSPAQVQALDLQVDADTRPWRAWSETAWLTVPGTLYNGNQVLPVSVDPQGLRPGTYEGTVMIGTDDGAQSDSTVVTLVVREPTLTASGGVLLGGIDGRDRSPAALTFALDTGSNAYPWNLALTTQDGAQWLSADGTSGQVSAAGVNIPLHARTDGIADGTYSGTARVTVDVDGVFLSHDVPVTLNFEAERLFPLTEGIALAALPSRSLLSREVQVVSSFGRTDATWQAHSDAAWLSVTPEGITGGSLTLVADPAGLASNAFHEAAVTIVSSDNSVDTGGSIRVGLWVGQADPAAFAVAVDAARIAVSPVEPLVFAHSAGSATIGAYNVYTGVSERTVTAPATVGEMAVSGDGRVLFAAADTKPEVYAIDTATGELRRTFAYSGASHEGLAGLLYARPNGRPTLIVANGYVFDVPTGALLSTDGPGPGYYDSSKIAITADSRTVFTHNLGLSPSTLSRYIIERSPLAGGFWSLFDGSTQAGSNGRDVAVSPDGARVYAASGGHYAFPVFAGDSLAKLGDLSGSHYPNNAAVAWNGTFAGGADAYYEDIDIWVYAGDGSWRGSTRCATVYGYSHLHEDALAFSGDGLRLACLASGSYGSAAALYLHDVP